MSVEANRASSEIQLLLKALCLPGYSRLEPASFYSSERAGLLSFPAPFRSPCRLLPAGASLWLLPAGSGTLTSLFYSCGQKAVHNVEAGSSRLCLEELDLSNTCFSEKTLSFSKPPRRESSFAAFLSVLDGNYAPGRGNGGTLQGSVVPGSARFRTVPSEEARRALLEARFLSNRAG